MAYLTLDDLQSLQAHSTQPCVSLYMPTHRTGREVEQDPIRFKNLLRDAEKRLESQGVKEKQISSLLQPARALIENKPFWQHQSDGLAVFVSESDFHHFRLPRSFTERVMVGARYYMKPLFPVVAGDGRFYLLAFSKKNVRLWQGSRDAVGEISLSGVDEALRETLELEDYQKQIQYHTGTPDRGGRRDAIYHGGGDTQTDTKLLTRQFFQRIDKHLVPFLRNQSAPLVLAGVDYLHPIYREVNQYPHLVDQGVIGNPDDLSADQLHQKAWQIVEPIFRQSMERARTKFLEQVGSAEAPLVSDIKRIIPAAHHGRIATLFVAVDEQQWGVFDEQSQTVQLREAQDNGADDLLDLAAVRALGTGSVVYAVKREEMPIDTPAAAILRY